MTCQFSTFSGSTVLHMWHIQANNIVSIDRDNGAAVKRFFYLQGYDRLSGGKVINYSSVFCPTLPLPVLLQRTGKDITISATIITVCQDMFLGGQTWFGTMGQYILILPRAAKEVSFLWATMAHMYINHHLMTTGKASDIHEIICLPSVFRCSVSKLENLLKWISMLFQDH